MANAEASAVIGILNKVMKYAVGLGVTASVLQTSLYTGIISTSNQKQLLIGYFGRKILMSASTLLRSGWRREGYYFRSFQGSAARVRRRGDAFPHPLGPGAWPTFALPSEGSCY